MSNQLNQLFKDTYTSKDPFDANAGMSYIFDDINKLIESIKNLDIYEVKLQKFGGRVDQTPSWGPVATHKCHSIELSELTPPIYRIISKRIVERDVPHGKIIGKETPKGKFVPSNKEWVYTRK